VSGGSNFPTFFTKAPMSRFFLEKIVQRVTYEKLKFKDGKDVEIYVNLVFVFLTGTALAIPQHSNKSPDELLKSLLVRTSSMLPKIFFTRNSNMILVLTVGLCRASLFVSLNEQGMVVEGERI